MEPTQETDPCAIPADAEPAVDPYVRLDCVRQAIGAAELGLVKDGKTVLDVARDIAAFVEDRETPPTRVEDFCGNTVAEIRG